MLSILPALLLLMFRGPSVADNPHLGSVIAGGVAYHDLRAPHSSTLPIANPIFASALSGLLQLHTPTLDLDQAKAVGAPSHPAAGLADACLECERSRDGPFGF